MIFSKNDRFNQDKGSLYSDFYEFIRLRNLLAKGATPQNINEWFAYSGKNKAESARVRNSMSSIRPAPGMSTNELNLSVDSPRKQKGRISVEHASVRQNVPYFFPEQVPGPGAYQTATTLLKPTFNRKGDAPFQRTQKINRKGIPQRDSNQPISLEDFEMTHNINSTFQNVNDGAYLNHKQTYRTRSAPPNRPPAFVPV
jgi:hypothetical protein